MDDKGKKDCLRKGDSKEIGWVIYIHFIVESVYYVPMPESLLWGNVSEVKM